MTWEELDWAALDRLRALFLKSEPVKEPYWRSESDLASYDFTYAQRIGWKWDAVLEELVRRVLADLEVIHLLILGLMEKLLLLVQKQPAAAKVLVIDPMLIFLIMVVLVEEVL
jgi:alpha-amylase/alpha-mannosidase (GH57 family)